jgi:aspartokinase
MRNNSIIVQKHGGACLETPAKIRSVASSLAELHSRGHRVVAIASAMGKTKVLHFRSVELTQSQNMPLVIKKSGSAEHSTEVMKEVIGMENGKVLAVNGGPRADVRLRPQLVVMDGQLLTHLS